MYVYVYVCVYMHTLAEVELAFTYCVTRLYACMYASGMYVCVYICMYVHAHLGRGEVAGDKTVCVFLCMHV
jgi:hypothetical protein